MLILQRLKNPKDIKAALVRDDLYKNILGQLEYKEENELATLLVFENNNPIGVVVLQTMPKNTVCVHAGIYKEYRKGLASQYLKQVVKKLKRVLYPLHLVTMVKEDNLLAIKAVRKVFKFKKIINIKNEKFLYFVE